NAFEKWSHTTTTDLNCLTTTIFLGRCCGRSWKGLVMSTNSLAKAGLEDYQKRFGAFYTDRKIAAFLVQWAVRDRRGKILDPSFGGGVFLEAAAEHLMQDGERPVGKIFGVEIDKSVHKIVSDRLQARYAIDPTCLIRSDFFGVHPEFTPKMSAVVGNPPFI